MYIYIIQGENDIITIYLRKINYTDFLRKYVNLTVKTRSRGRCTCTSKHSIDAQDFLLFLQLLSLLR